MSYWSGKGPHAGILLAMDTLDRVGEHDLADLQVVRDADGNILEIAHPDGARSRWHSSGGRPRPLEVETAEGDLVTVFAGGQQLEPADEYPVIRGQDGFAVWVEPLGTVNRVETPEGVVHFKTEKPKLSLLAESTPLSASPETWAEVVARVERDREVVRDCLADVALVI